jgi:hypothetical protein
VPDRLQQAVARVLNQSSSIASLHDRDNMVAATGELPASGYALEVDGRLKAEFATRTAPGQVEKS